MRSRAKVIVLPRDFRGETNATPIPAKRKYRANRMVVVLTMLFVVYSAVTFIHQEIKLRELRQDLQAILTEQQGQLREQDRLKDELEFARSSEYIERAAREKLGYLRPGDIFYIVNGKSTKQP